MTRVPGALLAVAVPVVCRVVEGPWIQRWGATDEGVNVQLPGDELTAE